MIPKSKYKVTESDVDPIFWGYIESIRFLTLQMQEEMGESIRLKEENKKLRKEIKELKDGGDK